MEAKHVEDATGADAVDAGSPRGTGIPVGAGGSFRGAAKVSRETILPVFKPKNI